MLHGHQPWPPPSFLCAATLSSEKVNGLHFVSARSGDGITTCERRYRSGLQGQWGRTAVKFLLTKDSVDQDLRDNGWRTPLSWAAEKGCEKAAKLLLADDGVDPDFKDNEGRTPLLLAAENRRGAVMKLLLVNGGVNPNVKNKFNRTPLSWAIQHGHEAVLKLLLAKYGAVVKLLLINDRVDPDVKDNNGRYRCRGQRKKSMRQ